MTFYNTSRNFSQAFPWENRKIKIGKERSDFTPAERTSLTGKMNAPMPSRLELEVTERNLRRDSFII